MYRKWY